MMICDEDLLGNSYYWLKRAFDIGHRYAPMLLGELFEEHGKIAKPRIGTSGRSILGLSMLIKNLIK